MGLTAAHRILHDLPHRSVVGRSQDPDDLIQLVVVVPTSEDGHSRDHFGKAGHRVKCEFEAQVDERSGTTDMQPALHKSMLVL